MIPDEKIAEIRERTDIVALVQEYVPLKRVGASFKGLCPFHSEKSPSFYVHPARQFYHCFGCQASGDAIGFFMQVDGRSFPEAARLLAERAGVEIPSLDPRAEAEYRRARADEERLVAMMDSAAGFYVRMLAEHPLASMAREELSRRGISEETARDFRLGYAPHGWDGLARFLAEKGHSAKDAEKLGLLLERRSGDGYYDRFRHRLQFPITDIQGRIVAFSGRMLDPPEHEPLESRTEPGAKYVNSPEGPLYKKSDILFGLHEGRVAVRREGWLLVCEGNFDLLALHQAGFQNAVAPMGTALTENHAKLIKRFADRAVLLFDGDKAGTKAVRAAAPLLVKASIAAKVVTLPPGDDPDTYLRAHGAEALRTLVDNAPSIFDHLIDEAASNAGGDPADKANAIGGLAPILATVGNDMERGLYIERVARKFGISDVSMVREQLRRALRMSRGQRRRPERDRPEPRREAPRRPLRLPPLEAELLGAILDNPELFATTEAADLERLLTSDELRGIFQAALGMVEERGAKGASGLDAVALLNKVAGNSAHSWLDGRLALQKYDRQSAERALRDGVPRINRQAKERQMLELNESIKAARRVGDEAGAMDLTRRRDELRQGAYQATKR